MIWEQEMCKATKSNKSKIFVFYFRNFSEIEWNKWNSFKVKVPHPITR